MKHLFKFFRLRWVSFWLIIISLFLILNTAPIVYGESTSGTLPHATDFLTLPNGPGGTTWYAKANASARQTAIQQLKNRGYTHLYISVVSGEHNYYGNPSGFKALLQELNSNGIKPVVWLTSDTGSWKDQSISVIKSALSEFIPQIDSLVNSYCMGIEIDEYWSESKADEIGNHLDSLTSKPIAVHQLPTAWGYCNAYCDYLILQYGFGKTESQIKTMTTSIKSSLGKPVVAGEYNNIGGSEATSVKLGNAGVSVGAAGFGNGGTVSGNPDPTPIPTPTPTPTPSPTPYTSSLIKNLSVKDSANASDWSVRPDMQEGNQMYGDRTLTFSSIPTFLEGADWIRAANDSKSYTGNPVASFTAGANITAYIVYDDRIISKPSWFTGWIDTGENIVDGDGLYLSVYAKNISSGTIVSLGPLVSSYTTSAVSMYVVAVKTQSIAIKKGDLNADNKVDIFDYTIFSQNFGKTGSNIADLNNDSKVDIFDFTIFAREFGK